MFVYPDINPVAFHLGPLKVHWYGLMYLFGFFAGWGLLRWRIKQGRREVTPEQLADIVFYSALGVVIGGRLGYMLFYDLGDLLKSPWHIFQVWNGGMSFHGGLLGVIIALWLYARSQHRHWIEFTDFIAPIVPIGLGAGRIGNFINGELWGRVTTMPWGFTYPAGGLVPHHPSQLYEFFCEGIILFIVLWVFSRKPRPRFAVSGLFLVGYGLLRFAVEFFRAPDVQIGFVAFGWLTKGQLLCVPMVIIGALMLAWAYRVTPFTKKIAG